MIKATVGYVTTIATIDELGEHPFRSSLPIICLIDRHGVFRYRHLRLLRQESLHRHRLVARRHRRRPAGRRAERGRPSVVSTWWRDILRVIDDNEVVS